MHGYPAGQHQLQATRLDFPKTTTGRDAAHSSHSKRCRGRGCSHSRSHLLCSAPPPGLIFRWAPPAAFPAGRPPASARDPSYYCPTGTGRWLVSCRGHFDLPRHLVVGHGALVTDRPATPNTDPGRGISFCWLLRQWQSYNYKLRVRAEGFVTFTVTGQDLFWCHWPLACQTD